jgi:pyroglutamyl-peptidase
MVHLGMRVKEDTYCIERQGHRDGYERPDVDGRGSDDKETREGGSWAGCPEVLRSAFDVDEVCKVCKVCKGNLPVCD